MNRKDGIQKRSVPNGRGSPEISSELTHTKKRLFWILTFFLPLVILALLEVSLRIIKYGNDTSLFISVPDESSKYLGINLEIAKRYFNRLSDVPTPRKDLFLKEKPKNGYRIFVLGESSAAGFPFGNNLTFTRILNRRLSDTFPDKHIEIVNTAMTAINSYAQLDFMEEILQQEPDAILIYAGHNEYYGALGVGSMESLGKQRWLVKTALALQKYKTYNLLRNIINDIKGWFDDDSSIITTGDPNATLMERIVEKKIIPLNSEDYESGKNQFRENLSEIIRMAQDAGVKVLVSELVSNIRDNEPFESIKSNGFPSAKKIFETAINYEVLGKFDEAKKAFYQAKDLDALRFRAPEEFNGIIHELADEFNVPVVPMKSYFESHSPNGLIGNNLMFEHLHPNYDGYFLMADAFFNIMRKEEFISNNWPQKNIEASSYYSGNWGFTSLDSIYAYLNIERLKGGWPFKKGKGLNLSILDFEPKSKVDSIAVEILTSGKLTLEQGHIELANYFESRGELDEAFNEYNALIYTVPYFDLFYQPAVKILVEMGSYDKALEILYESLKYQETVFAYKWIGQIYLINNETLKGISFLEKARDIGTNDFVLLYNLGRAYFKSGQIKQGDNIINQLKSNLSAEQPGSAEYTLISKLEEYRKSSYKIKQDM